MRALVVTQIQAGDHRRGERPGRNRHQFGLSRQREHAAVVVSVAVPMEKGRAGGFGELLQCHLVAALADVHHALDDLAGHRASITPGVRTRVAG